MQMILFGIACVFYALVEAPAVTFFVNCYLLLESGYGHFEVIFKEIDELTNKPVEKNEKCFKLRLIDGIKLHNGLTR